MNKQKFIDIIRDPEGGDASQVNELQKVLFAYPYFAIGRTILAQLGKLQDHSDSKKWLGSAAVYATDRKHLKKYINGELIFLADKPKVSEPDPEIAVSNQPSSEAVTSTVSVETPSPLRAELDQMKVPTEQQMDHLLEELERDLEELKKSRMHFVSIQDQIDEEKPVTSASRIVTHEASEISPTVKSDVIRAGSPLSAPKPTDENMAFRDEPQPEPESTTDLSIQKSTSQEVPKDSSAVKSDEKKKIRAHSTSNETTIDDSTIEALKKSVIEEVEKDKKPTPRAVTQAQNEGRYSDTKSASTSAKENIAVPKSIRPQVAATTEEKPNSEAIAAKEVNEASDIDKDTMVRGSRDPDSAEFIQKRPTSSISQSFMELNEKLRKQSTTSISKASSRRTRTRSNDESSSESVAREVRHTASKPVLDENESRFNRPTETPGSGKIAFSGSNKNRQANQEVPNRAPNKEEIINTFIEKNPSISTNKLKKTESLEDLAASSTQWNDELATESLAEIYLAQGHKKKAVKIYEALQLKFPDKKTYFAGLIDKL